MPYKVTSAPAVEPISTSEAKTHLYVDTSDHDTYIGTLITTARRLVEELTWRAMITQTIEIKYDKFPSEFVIPRGPLQSITSITYLDTDGASQTWSSSNYSVDTHSDPGRVTRAYGQDYPSIRDIDNAVTVTAVVGYGDASTDVPEDLIHAMKIIIGDLFENRESMGWKDKIKPIIDLYRLQDMDLLDAI